MYRRAEGVRETALAGESRPSLNRAARRFEGLSQLSGSSWLTLVADEDVEGIGLRARFFVGVDRCFDEEDVALFLPPPDLELLSAMNSSRLSSSKGSRRREVEAAVMFYPFNLVYDLKCWMVLAFGH